MYPVDKIEYQRHHGIHGIPGFITNVYDAVNFDICFILTPEQKREYNDVVTEEFSYIDFDGYQVPTNINNTDQHSTGYTYRCRLKGVGVNENAHKECKHRVVYGKNGSHAAIDVSRLIDRANGWVMCNITDVDVYRRMLVDITVPLPSAHETINIRNYLLTASSTYGGMFYSYGTPSINRTYTKTYRPEIYMPWRS